MTCQWLGLSSGVVWECRQRGRAVGKPSVASAPHSTHSSQCSTYGVNSTFKNTRGTPPENGHLFLWRGRDVLGKLDGMMRLPMRRALFEHCHQRRCSWPS